MTETIEINVGASADDVNNAIRSASDGAVIVFETGTHVFDDTITIRRSDISIQGASDGGAVVKFRFDADGSGIVDAGEGGSGFEVLGFGETSNRVRKADRDVVEQAIEAGQNTFVAADTSQLAVGDVVHISQINTTEYLDGLGGCEAGTPCRDTAENRSFREFISTIIAIDPTTGEVTLSEAIPYAMDPAEAPVRIAELKDIRRDVSISDLTIEFEIFDPVTGAKITPDPDVFSNEQPGFLSDSRPASAAIYLEGTTGATLSGISVINAPSQGFAIRNSIGVTGNDLSVTGSFNKGAGGNGYGLDIYETFNSTFSNLDLYDVRHAVLFSAWNAEVGNTVHVANTNRDMNFHGSPDRDNTVTVDNAILDHGASPEIWAIVSNGGRIVHQQTDIYGEGNVVTFGNAQGTGRDELIYANDTGAVLRGEGGRDILVAGAGSDTLDGGDGYDRVSYETATERVWVDLRGNMPFQHGAAGDQLISIEAVEGSAFNDLLLGNDASNFLKGGGGDDVLFGRSGDDLVKGGTGDDTLHGQRGNDVLFGGAGADVFHFDDFAGADTIADFDIGVDQISFERIDAITGYDDVVLSDTTAGTEVTFTDDAGVQSTALLSNIELSDMSESDFIFV